MTTDRLKGLRADDLLSHMQPRFPLRAATSPHQRAIVRVWSRRRSEGANLNGSGNSLYDARRAQLGQPLCAYPDRGVHGGVVLADEGCAPANALG